VSVRLVVLLGGKGVRVRVNTPFINAFKRRKLGICPNPPQISAISKPVFFSSKCDDLKTLFFPLLEMWRFSFSFFFFEIFQNAHFTMYVFMGNFSTDFHHKK
jgi:hypothetical protein